LDYDQERRSFDFFRQRTVPQLSGAFDSDEFWQRLLLQATHHEPAIRHAAVALGALHERFETSDDTTNLTFKLNEKKTHDVFALQQYSKAIKALLEPNEAQGKQAADVALMTCVLFIYFEVSIHLYTMKTILTFHRLFAATTKQQSLT
jgi:Fungal specific transcription factor domain